MNPKLSVLTAALGLIMSATARTADTAPLGASKTILISSLPYTISAPGTYVLNSDLICPAQPVGAAAITILTTLSGPVVVDFQGHKITGPGGSIQNFGVSIGSPLPTENSYPITIKGGTLQDFEIGVDAEQGNRAATTEITIKNISFATVTTTIETYGVKFLQVNHSNVSYCSFVGASSGIVDESTGGSNRYLSNSFTNVSSMISVGNIGYNFPTFLIEDCEVSAPAQ